MRKLLLISSSVLVVVLLGACAAQPVVTPDGHAAPATTGQGDRSSAFTTAAPTIDSGRSATLPPTGEAPPAAAPASVSTPPAAATDSVARPTAAAPPSAAVAAPAQAKSAPRSFSVALQSGRVAQGDFTLLRLTPRPGFELEAVSVSGLQSPLRAYRYGGTWLAVVAASYHLQPGSYRLSLQVRGKAPGGEPMEETFSVPLEVAFKKFTEQRLYVDQKTADLRKDPQIERDGQAVAKARGQSHPEPLWTGRFLQPVAGEITTEFGEIRYVNDEEDGRHNGTDIAAPTDTPVKATNAGRVVLAQRLVLTGFTVIIDHGLNVFSSYSHLNSMAVKAGDRVERGQVVGAVGTTGFSNGPHLHWVVSVGGTAVNPVPLVQSGLLDR